jgi:hypothetical protein
MKDFIHPKKKKTQINNLNNSTRKWRQALSKSLLHNAGEAILRTEL